MSDLLKAEVDFAIQKLQLVMREIKLADEEYEKEEDPDRSALIANYILKLGSEFDIATADAEDKLRRYINELSELKMPIPLNYSKLLKQIRSPR
jgi:hypothetical protein